jgi:hypothetical protein
MPLLIGTHPRTLPPENCSPDQWPVLNLRMATKNGPSTGIRLRPFSRGVSADDDPARIIKFRAMELFLPNPW